MEKCRFIAFKFIAVDYIFAIEDNMFFSASISPYHSKHTAKEMLEQPLVAEANRGTYGKLGKTLFFDRNGFLRIKCDTYFQTTPDISDQ